MIWLTLIAVAGDLDFSEDKSAHFVILLLVIPHVTAWQLVDSICTTDSAVGPEKLRQKPIMMAKLTVISLACYFWWCHCYVGDGLPAQKHKQAKGRACSCT